MLRSVKLPDDCDGVLLLHSMPGWAEPLEMAVELIRAARVDTIVSLTGLDEVGRKSPAYMQAIEDGRLPCARVEFAIREFDVPDDAEAFWNLAHEVAAGLRRGQRLLIHCLAGIGRTGMLAECVLLALGVDLDAARQTVRAAGSGAETHEQSDLVTWYARRYRPGGAGDPAPGL